MKNPNIENVPGLHDYIVQNVKGRNYSELTRAINAKFHLSYCEAAICNFCHRNGINNGIIAAQFYYRLNEEQLQIIKDNANGDLPVDEIFRLCLEKGFCTRKGVIRNLRKNKIPKWRQPEKIEFLKARATMPRAQVAAEFNEHFKTNVKRHQICTVMNGLGLYTGNPEKRRSYKKYKKGDERWRHSHAHDDCPRTYREVYDGTKFIVKSRYVWQQAYGPIEKGMVVIHLNNDHTDDRLENLALIPNSLMGLMNQHKLFSTDPEKTKVGITIAKLHHEQSLRIKEKKNEI